MIEIFTIASKFAPQIVQILRQAYGRSEYANSLTSEQKWVRRLLKRKDGFKLVTSQVTKVLFADRSLKLEIGGTEQEWLTAGDAVEKILGTEYKTRDRLLDLVTNPEGSVIVCIESPCGRETFHSLYGEEVATARLMVTLQCSLSVIQDLVQYANWFPTGAAISQLRSLQRTEVRMDEVLAAITSIQAATAVSQPNSQTAWAVAVDASIRVLNQPPEYYPDQLSNTLLAEDIRVTRVNGSSYGNLDQGELYWRREFNGVPEILNDTVVDSPLTVLLGNPGSGKSTLAKELFIRRLQQNRVAAFARLDDLAAILDSAPSPLSEQHAIAAVAEAMGRTVRTYVPFDVILDAAREVRDEGLDSSKVLLVLDGLDEIPNSSGRLAIKQLVSLLVECGYRILLTSRVSGYHTPWENAGHVAVLPLADEAVSKNAERWFRFTSNTQAYDRYRLVAGDEGLSTVVINPSTLGFVCFVAEHGNIPTNKATIFEKFVDHFLRRKWHHASQWIDDDATIANLTEMATDVAWSMARYRHGKFQLLWRDTAILSELEGVTESAEALYGTYNSGLLIPFGLLESPISGRFQRVRWMHRVIHEYFVARKLAQKISTHSEDSWSAFLNSVLYSSWNGAVDQTFQLLGDGRALHDLMERIQSELAARDTPDQAIATTLLWAGRYCNCLERRKEITEILVDQENWKDAFIFSTDYAVELAISKSVSSAEREKIIGSLSELSSFYSTFSERHVDALIQASILDLSNPKHAKIVWMIRLQANTLLWWPRALESARSTGRIPRISWSAPDYDSTTAAVIADALVQHFTTGPSQISAMELMSCLNDKLVTELRQRGNLPARLAIAVEVYSHFSQEKDVEYYSNIAVLMQSGPQQIRDIAWLGPALQDHVDWRPSNPIHRDILACARAALYFESLQHGPSGWNFEPPMILTESSLPLAEEIINKIDVNEIQSINAIETIIWALSVAVISPSSRILDKLSLLRNTGWDPSLDLSDPAVGSIDASTFVAVLNGQDWKTLVGQAQRDLALGFRKDRSGMILCTAADIWTTKHSVREIDRNFIRPKMAVELFVKGLEAILSSDTNSYLEPLQIGDCRYLPDGLPDEFQIDLAKRIIGLTDSSKGIHPPSVLSKGFRKGAERSLEGLGALSYFYLDIAE